MKNSHCVCIIDDDEAIRESLRLLLSAAGISSHEFDSTEAFLARSDTRHFDCMLLDIRMPGMDGFELFQALMRAAAVYPIIFITGHGDIPLAVSAIKQGAFDFLTKPFREGELLEKVRAAIAYGQRQLSHRERHQEALRRAEICTPRERDVMRLMVQGLSNKGIAEALQISPRTVEIHRAHVMEKMQADSLPDLVRLAAELGME